MSVTLTVTCIKIQIIYRSNTLWHILLHFHWMGNKIAIKYIHSIMKYFHDSH